MKHVVSFISFIIASNKLNTVMQGPDVINKPSKDEQRQASLTLRHFEALLSKIDSDFPEIEVEETKERIKIPLSALKLLNDILKAMSKGRPVSIVPLAAEVTTQKAAEILGCSRPHVIKLLEDGNLPYTKVGKHRRIKFEEVEKYRIKMKRDQKQRLIDMMKSDEEDGLYDS